MYGAGIYRMGEIIDLGVKQGFIDKSVLGTLMAVTKLVKVKLMPRNT